jgi:uncharacterized protein (TIGR02145 family)
MINNKPKNSVRLGTVRQSKTLRFLYIWILLATCLLPVNLFAQTEPSALFEIQSTDKGFLLPRMTEAQRDAIVNPAKGLVIYNTTSDCADINFGTSDAPLWQGLSCRQGILSTLDCNGAVMTGKLSSGTAAIGVSVKVPYTNINGGMRGLQLAISTGVSGLTAIMAEGNFSTGTDSLVYTIMGAPSSGGTASFALNIGGQSCILNLKVACGAFVSPGLWKEFMCHNLASANTSAGLFTPSWEINGGYWQWGRKGPDSPQWLNTNTANFAHGPIGPGFTQANDAAISGWSQAFAPSGSWSDGIKTANDPCPAGFRVPTKTQWEGVIANNPQSITGSWASSTTNYTAGYFLGPALMLPAAGYRNDYNGSLFFRGLGGFYWSSTGVSTSGAWNLRLNSSYSSMNSDSHPIGYSVRCIVE